MRLPSPSLLMTLLVACAARVPTVAGTWTFAITPAGGGRVFSTAILVATADTSGWTLTLPNGPALPLHVTRSADSVMVESPRHESSLHPGVQLVTTAVYRIIGDSMIGTMLEHYAVSGHDSLVELRSAGVKVTP